MGGSNSRQTRRLIALVAAFAIVPPAIAVDVSVDCNKKKSITAALATLSKQGPHTVTVSGECNESVVIRDFDGLTLRGTPGASINDPTPADLEDNLVLDVQYTRNMVVRDLTINGGTSGVSCGRFSNCDLQNLVVQGASGFGVSYFRSGDGLADNVTIQSCAFGGLSVSNGSNVGFGGGFLAPGTSSTIQNNGSETDGGIGIQVGNGSNLTLSNAIVKDTVGGPGISVQHASFARMVGVTITGNGAHGIQVLTSVVRITGVYAQPGIPAWPIGITGNAGNGIHVGHLSFVGIGGPRVVSGNVAPDVNCSVETAKTSGAFTGSGAVNLGGGTTNCIEPAP